MTIKCYTSKQENTNGVLGGPPIATMANNLLQFQVLNNKHDIPIATMANNLLQFQVLGKGLLLTHLSFKEDLPQYSPHVGYL